MFWHVPFSEFVEGIPFSIIELFHQRVFLVAPYGFSDRFVEVAFCSPLQVVSSGLSGFDELNRFTREIVISD